MKSQTKLFSFIESITNAAIGILTSFLFQMWVFPFFGINVSASTNIQITMLFFVFSIVRSFAVRRFFNQIN